MASNLFAATERLGFSAPKETQRIRGFTGQNYQAATIQVDPDAGDNFKKFAAIAEFAQQGYKIYDDYQKSKADERSDEIIRKLTPAQRREAMADGTLLYQDNPYAMKAFREKVGRSAAFSVDNEISEMVKQGSFKNRQELEDFRYKRLQDGAKEFASLNGLTETDEDYQRGFNSDIVRRNINIYGSHDTFLSDQARKGSMAATRMDINSILGDRAFMESSQSGRAFNEYMRVSMANGSIVSDDDAKQVIAQSLQDAASKPGGYALISNLEKQNINIYGKDVSYKELLEENVWNNLKVQAQESAFKLDAKAQERFSLKLNEAMNTQDPIQALTMIQQLEAENNVLQPGEELTANRKSIIQAKQSLQDRVAADTQRRSNELGRQVQGQNRQLEIEDIYNKRLNGEYVSTDYKDFPTNDATGEFKQSDMNNYAANKLAQIDAMTIPDEEKDRLKLKYLRADSKDGPFRALMGTLVTDAGSEWSSSTINGKLPDATPAMDNLRRVYKEDPSLMAALYPEKVDLFTTLDLMDKYGIDPQVMIEADRQKSSMSRDMQIEADKAYASMKNDSNAPELARIPTSLDGMARKVYDAVMYRTGNSDLARQQVSKFVTDNTQVFKNSNADGKTVGVISNRSLQVTDDPASVKQGTEIMQGAIDGFLKVRGWLKPEQVTVYEQGDSIYIMDTTGQERIRYDRDILSRVYQEQLQQNVAKQELKKEEAIKKGQVRSRHSRYQEARRNRIKKRNEELNNLANQ